LFGGVIAAGYCGINFVALTTAPLATEKFPDWLDFNGSSDPKFS